MNKKVEKNIFAIFQNPKIFNEKSKILVQMFSIFHWKFSDFEKSQKYFFSTFSKIFFISKKKSWKNTFYLYQSKISPGFQKSHIESRVMSVEIRKIGKTSNFQWKIQLLSQISQRWPSLISNSELLTSLTTDPLLDPPKSKVQTMSRQKQWSRLHILFAKINYFCDGRTDARTDIRLSGAHGRKERFAQ